MRDRYKFNQFLDDEYNVVKYATFQEFNEEVYVSEHLEIATLAMDFSHGTSKKVRDKIEAKWIDMLPSLEKVKSLSVRHIVKNDFFEAICKMPNLENLTFWTSRVENITSIRQLKKLKKLKLWRFALLKDISPLLHLNNLSILSIDNCFKVENYEIIGQMTQLVGLELCGDSFAPKKLILSSLKPFESLKNLKHLDLSSASVNDKSYDSILEMNNLERFDLVVTVPRDTRDRIKENHKTLKAGFFVDYDFENKKFYDGKVW